MGLAAFNRMRREQAQQAEMEAEKVAEKESNDDANVESVDYSKLKVDEIKEKLAELSVEIPAGVTKKDDLLKLLKASLE